MTCRHDTRLEQACATDRVDRAIAEVLAGRRTIDKAWHQLRGWQPTLAQWQAFASACRIHGRTNYTARWALHQFRCWTELSDAGTYPEQRARWALKQERFEQAMRAKSGRVLTNAEIRAAGMPAVEPDHQQLGLFN